MQRFLSTVKIENFIIKNLRSFNTCSSKVFAQTSIVGTIAEAFLTSTHNLCFGSKIKNEK